ncbi:hypothetical protein F442_03090 [Phytophthora nicotianae P10297]|uniref:Uncharacterized protein n=4 Tax=Phytophthora nicotianae TaxID=4792 RepID=V9ECC0_PHYNI|nr:hypothetical protein F443_17322 [Phytophthora nicotianae P1569]ETM36687.1 hypothetical protein L914_16676 [Phytophthora nicotianae]ETO84324.1 hypothetical protein F444_01756 [Phytophthora nicotianae P1976]ETP51824.1 hypothetical protein F442_03090 [Phytophthora nicotianae P10297]
MMSPSDRPTSSSFAIFLINYYAIQRDFNFNECHS